MAQPNITPHKKTLSEWLNQEHIVPGVEADIRTAAEIPRGRSAVPMAQDRKRRAVSRVIVSSGQTQSVMRQDTDALICSGAQLVDQLNASVVLFPSLDRGQDLVIIILPAKRRIEHIPEYPVLGQRSG